MFHELVSPTLFLFIAKSDQDATSKYLQGNELMNATIRIPPPNCRSSSHYPHFQHQMPSPKYDPDTVARNGPYSPQCCFILSHHPCPHVSSSNRIVSILNGLKLLGHIRLIYSFLLSSLEPPTCSLRHSEVPLTVSHILLSCPASDLFRDRIKLLPDLFYPQSSPQIQTISSSPTLTSYLL